MKYNRRIKRKDRQRTNKLIHLPSCSFWYNDLQCIEQKNMELGLLVEHTIIHLNNGYSFVEYLPKEIILELICEQ